MAASTFQLGRGGTLGAATTSTGTVTPIGQLKSVSFSGAKSDFDDITNLGSPSNFREFVPTILDSGNVSFHGVWAQDDPGQMLMATSFAAQTLLYFTLQFALTGTEVTKGLSVTFSAYVSDLPLPDMNFDKASVFTGQLKITGPVTVTAGS